MNEDHLNLEIRKFLKKVGISSQRLLESKIKDFFKNKILKIGDELEIEMKMTIKNHSVEHLVSDKTKIE